MNLQIIQMMYLGLWVTLMKILKAARESLMNKSKVKPKTKKATDEAPTQKGQLRYNQFYGIKY